MMSDWNQLRDQVLGLLKEETRDLWEEEDEEFLRALALDITREKFLATTGGEVREHEKNLRHLAATLTGEIVRNEIRLNRKGRELFARIVGTVIRAVAMPALSAAIGR